MIVENCVT